MKKQIIITRILEFGGSNTYLKTLIKYFGKENIILVLTNTEDFNNLKKIDPDNELLVEYFPGFYDYANFNIKNNPLKRFIREIFYFIRALTKILFLSLKNNFASVSISAIDPEKYLYLFWLPFVKVNYILHSDPIRLLNRFTTITCNTRLSHRKKIITVSYANKNSILKCWKISSRNTNNVQVIYNCLLEDKPEENDFLSNAENRIILTMGHVVEYKNPQLWLDVARRVVTLRKDVSFYWLGNGPLLKLYQEETIDNEHINFIGLIENPGSFLSKATMYYQPSLYETQGIGVIEAMSRKLPCVVSNVGGLPESVENRKNGFIVDAYDVDENVDRIIELLDNKSLCNSFGKYSYNKYIKYFNFDKFKSDMDNIFN